MLNFEVIDLNGSKQLVAELTDAAVIVSPALVSLQAGKLKLATSPNDLKLRMQAKLYGPKFIQSKIIGNGKLWLQATVGDYYCLELIEQESYVIRAENFVAATPTVKFAIKTTASVSNFLSGVPNIQLIATGPGSVWLRGPGQMQQLAVNDKLLAYDQLIQAYSTDIKLTRKSVPSSWLVAKHKLVNHYRGEGKIIICPKPNKACMQVYGKV